MTEAFERRSQAERRSRSEDALLEAAAEVVAERGVQGASLASIGGRAGVSRGLPTHHFGSKDALVAQLAERAQTRIALVIFEAQRRHAEVSGHQSVLDEILVGVDAYLELFEDPGPDERALLVMWGSTFPSNASVEGMADAERRSYEGLSQRIASGQDDASIRIGRRPHGQRRAPPWSDAGGGRPVPLRQPPGGHARRAPDLSRMDCLGPGAALRELPS